MLSLFILYFHLTVGGNPLQKIPITNFYINFICMYHIEFLFCEPFGILCVACKLFVSEDRKVHQPCLSILLLIMISWWNRYHSHSIGEEEDCFKGKKRTVMLIRTHVSQWVVDRGGGVPQGFIAFHISKTLMALQVQEPTSSWVFFTIITRASITLEEESKTVGSTQMHTSLVWC